MPMIGRLNSNFANAGVERRRSLIRARTPNLVVVVADLLSRLQRQQVIVRDQDRLAR
jgi:hypothetical protein